MKTRILLFTLLLFGLLIHTVAADNIHWKTHQTTFFSIYYQEDSIADQVETIATQHWNEIRTYIPITGGVRISIYLYPKRDQFLKAIGEKQESGIVGIAYSQGNIVRVDASQIYASLNRVLAHELTHIALFEVMGDRIKDVPLWFNEGLARHEEGELTGNDIEALSSAVTNNTILPLSSLEEYFPKDPQKESLAYAEAASVVEYLIKHHGSESLFTVVQRMRDGMQFETALRDATGLIPITLERAWVVSLKKTHRWDWLETLYMPIVSMVMVLLCFAAWIAMRRKRRRIIQKFDEDEFNDFLNR